jgi:hypothetical protein
MALIGVWHRNVWGFAAHAVIPYDQRLARFPAYLQQLDMESNGKSVHFDGAPVERATGPVIFGEPGTNGQHAFFQLLHQGTEIVPVDFIVAAAADGGRRASPQSAVRQLPRPERGADARPLARRGGGDAGRAGTVEAPRSPRSRRTRSFPATGRPRPSSIAASRPAISAELVALYEHKVFVQSAIWDINPFDQWGVELGKELCNRLAPDRRGPASRARRPRRIDDGGPHRGAARPASLLIQGVGLLILAEAIGDERVDGVERGLRVRAGGRHRDRRALAGAERQNAHDRGSAHRLAAARHRDVGLEPLDALHEFRRRPGVQTLAVDDGHLPHQRPLGRSGIGRAVAIVHGRVVRHFALRNLLAT